MFFIVYDWPYYLALNYFKVFLIESYWKCKQPLWRLVHKHRSGQRADIRVVSQEGVKSSGPWDALHEERYSNSDALSRICLPRQNIHAACLLTYFNKFLRIIFFTRSTYFESLLNWMIIIFRFVVSSCVCDFSHEVITA